MNSRVKAGEYLEDLQRNGLKIIQTREGYRFSADAVLLAHFAGAFLSRGTVVDLGTGSGIILLLLSALCPETSLVGLELQPDMADMARRSVLLNELENRIEILQGDIREAERILSPGTADAVVSNPPYVPVNTGPANCRRDIALSRQELACSLEDVFAAAGRLLKNRGHFFMVHKPGRLADICCLGRQFALEPKRLRMVLPRPDREPTMVLVHCVKASAPGMIVLPPLMMTDEQGNVTEEVKKLYGTGE